MLVEELLLKILEDLLKADFDEFKWFLSLEILGSCAPIPRARLQDASRTDAVDKLLRSYGEETAVKITAEVLKKMRMNKAAEELTRLYAAGEAHATSSQRHSVPNISSIHRKEHAVFFLFLPHCSVTSRCDDSSGGERDHRADHHGWRHHHSVQYNHQQLKPPDPDACHSLATVLAYI